MEGSPPHMALDMAGQSEYGNSGCSTDTDLIRLLCFLSGSRPPGNPPLLQEVLGRWIMPPPTAGNDPTDRGRGQSDGPPLADKRCVRGRQGRHARSGAAPRSPCSSSVHMLLFSLYNGTLYRRRLRVADARRDRAVPAGAFPVRCTWRSQEPE